MRIEEGNSDENSRGTIIMRRRGTTMKRIATGGTRRP
jgi:hypothetical protein